MCGRFTCTIDLLTFIKFFKIDLNNLDRYEPRYNIAPTQEIPTVIWQNGKRVAQNMRWGLVPSWAKVPGVGNKMVNARAETLDVKPAYRKALLHRRCLVPADGFYEWMKEGKKKQPLRFVLSNNKPFAFAGLWDNWVSPEGKSIISCTVITTDPNEVVKTVHDRMPVILTEEDQCNWLNPDYNPEHLKTMLVPYGGKMKAYPVSDLVNSPKNDFPEVLSGSSASEQISLF